MQEEEFPETRVQKLTELVDESIGRSVKVLDLLQAVGTRRRSAMAVEAIEHVLSMRGLEAWPPVTVAPLDGDVAIQRQQDRNAEPKTTEEILPEIPSPPAFLEPTRPSPRLGLYVGNILSSTQDLPCVLLQEEPRTVLTMLIMRPREPVLVFRDTQRRLLEGVVTWETIVRFQLSHGFQEPPTLASILRHVSSVREDDDLLPLVSRIVEQEYVAVIDAARRVKGILNVADLARHFIERTRPYLLVGDIEQILRSIIHRRLKDSWGEIARLEAGAYESTRMPSSPDELTFGTYVRVLQNPDYFNRLGWRIDRKLFVQKLDEVREIRNDIMHFSPDPAPDAVPQLGDFIELLRIAEPTIVGEVNPLTQ